MADFKTVARELRKAVDGLDGDKLLTIEGPTVGEIRLRDHRPPGYLPPGNYDVHMDFMDPESGEKREIYRNKLEIPPPAQEPDGADPEEPEEFNQTVSAMRWRDEVDRLREETFRERADQRDAFYNHMMEAATASHERQIQFLTEMISTERERFRQIITEQAKNARAAIAAVKSQLVAEAEASGGGSLDLPTAIIQGIDLFAQHMRGGAANEPIRSAQNAGDAD